MHGSLGGAAVQNRISAAMPSLPPPPRIAPRRQLQGRAAPALPPPSSFLLPPHPLVLVADRIDSAAPAFRCCRSMFARKRSGQ